MIYISENLKFLCHRHRLTQNELGETLGLNRGVISSYVSGKASPSIETLVNISNIYGHNIDEFICNDLEVRPANRSNTSVDTSIIEGALNDARKLVAVLERENNFLRGSIERCGGQCQAIPNTAPKSP